MTPNVPEALTVQSGLDALKAYILPGLAGLTGLAAASQVIKLKLGVVVSEGEVGLIVWLGRAYKKHKGEDGKDILYGAYGPGLRWRIPVLRDIRKVDAAGRTTHFAPLSFEHPEAEGGKQVVVDGGFRWRVAFGEPGSHIYGRLRDGYAENVLKAVTMGEAALVAGVGITCITGIRVAMQSLPYAQIIDNSAVYARTKIVLKDRLEEEFGVQLLAVEIGSVALSAAEKLGTRMVEAAIQSHGQPETDLNRFLETTTALHTEPGLPQLLNGNATA